MNALNAAMTVIGAGSYGTALAITLARNGHHVVLWGHDPKHIATLQHDRCNAAFLPDVPFPDTLHLESDLATALAASRDILVVVPSHVFGQVLRQIKPLMRSDARLCARRAALAVGPYARSEKRAGRARAGSAATPYPAPGGCISAIERGSARHGSSALRQGAHRSSVTTRAGSARDLRPQYPAASPSRRGSLAAT